MSSVARVADELAKQLAIHGACAGEVPVLQVAQQTPQPADGGAALTLLRRGELDQAAPDREGNAFLGMAEKLELSISLVPERPVLAPERGVKPVDQVDVRSEPPD